MGFLSAYEFTTQKITTLAITTLYYTSAIRKTLQYVWIHFPTIIGYFLFGSRPHLWPGIHGPKPDATVKMRNQGSDKDQKSFQNLVSNQDQEIGPWIPAFDNEENPISLDSDFSSPLISGSLFVLTKLFFNFIFWPNGNCWWSHVTSDQSKASVGDFLDSYFLLVTNRISRVGFQARLRESE